MKAKVKQKKNVIKLKLTRVKANERKITPNNKNDV